MRFLLVLICFVWGHALAAQQPDMPVPDTLGPVLEAGTSVPDSSMGSGTDKPGFVRRIFTQDYPDPKTAAFLSLALPGTGQIYNKKWWKVPIVYVVLGGLTYIEIDNINEYRRLRDNYKLLVDGDDMTNPTEPPYSLLDATSMKQYRDQWRRYVEQSSLALGLAYILTATEAFVDAHLSRFDVSDDLTLRLQPTFQASPASGLTYGFGITVQFGGPRVPSFPVSP
ncbi:MAG: hypothetical protein EP344_13305 [Bacteroidetes bacterium]|nr:MAG: hypothetical protein EP344_13305 [Bacteroidota bacterium]